MLILDDYYKSKDGTVKSCIRVGSDVGNNLSVVNTP